MIFIAVLAIGIFLILLSIRLRAKGKLSIDLCTVWGMAGIGIICMNILYPVRIFWEGLDKSLALGLLICGVFLIYLGLWFSIRQTKWKEKKQESLMEETLRRDEKKSLLFVVNTLGRAGAETLLLQVLKECRDPSYEVFLYVILGQGELFDSLPSYVKVLNSAPSSLPVLSSKGRRRMVRSVLKAFVRKGNLFRKSFYIIRTFKTMREKGRFQADKLFWRVLAEAAPPLSIGFDLAVAWMEGGSAYYVADYVKADKKIAMIHIDYESAGYTHEMDQGCWDKFSTIFTVSREVRQNFAVFYPQYASRLRIFPSSIDRAHIRALSQKTGGFTDGYRGMRLLTVGRLTYQKGYDMALEVLALLKKRGLSVRWYVLGEGEERKTLERKRAKLGLTEDFILLGAVENPYPYYVQTDIYVHATRFEGKSIALQEAMALGCAVIVSDCNGNREEIIDGSEGILCPFEPAILADCIEELLGDGKRRKDLGEHARARRTDDICYGDFIRKLMFTGGKA